MERIAFEYRKDEPFRVVKDGCIGTIRTMEGGGVSKYIMEVKVIGQMDNTIDHTFESANRVYDKNGLAPTINTCGGGGLQPKVIDEVKELGFMDNVNTENIIIGGEQDICRIEKKCISTKGKENDVASTILSGYERSNMTGFNADNGVLEQYYLSEKGKRYVCDPKRGMCTDINAEVCQTLTAKGQSNWTGSFVSPDIDRLEKSTNIGSEEPTLIHLKDGRTITSNDCLTQYRIRKLTPRECYRLMAVPEESIDKMLEVNSNTQCYKQAGNSIVVNCLVAIFSQMGIQSIPRWNEGLSEKYK